MSQPEQFDNLLFGSGKSGNLLEDSRSPAGSESPKSIAKARAQVEEASTKANPREWIGRVLNNPKNAQTDGPIDWRTVL